MNKKKDISKEDIKIWKDYTNNPKDILDKDSHNENYQSNNVRYKFDLHGYSLDDANSKVEELIMWCSKKKYKEILLITGKGIHSNTDENVFVSKNLSKLKYSVPEYINSHIELSKQVYSILDAKKEDGGAGALIIRLKKFTE